MGNTRLTEQQLAQFDTFGYLGFPGLLADRAAAIIEEFETLWAKHGGGHAGKPHDGQARSAMVQFLDQSEYLSTLLDDPRIHDLAASLLGDDFNYMGSDGNFYAGDTRWHSDGYGGRGGLRHIKIAFYLDPLTRNSGALRVIPGSHRLGDPYADELERDLRNSETVWGITGSQVPAMALETVAGDVLVFNHDIKHSAWGGSKRRRMFTMNCCQRYPEAQLDVLREYISHGSRFWIERAYDDTIVRTAAPERMVHLEQVLANDGHLAELSRQRRAADPEPARG
jgi:ectoine hydroxylase-related dioxygenase (phytanoyl-CoA dioxygenase family)